MKSYFIACFALLFLNVAASSAQAGSETILRPKPRPENLDTSGQEQLQDETTKTLKACIEPVFDELANLGIPEITLQLRMSKDAKVTGVRLLPNLYVSRFSALLYAIASSAFMNCGNRVGFDLPLDAYEQWRVMEITLNATRRKP